MSWKSKNGTIMLTTISYSLYLLKLFYYHFFQNDSALAHQINFKNCLNNNLNAHQKIRFFFFHFFFLFKQLELQHQPILGTYILNSMWLELCYQIPTQLHKENLRPIIQKALTNRADHPIFINGEIKRKKKKNEESFLHAKTERQQLHQEK